METELLDQILQFSVIHEKLISAFPVGVKNWVVLGPGPGKEEETETEEKLREASTAP